MTLKAYDNQFQTKKLKFFKMEGFFSNKIFSKIFRIWYFHVETFGGWSLKLLKYLEIDINWSLNIELVDIL